ncbi:MAG: hypothetical protein LBN43_01585, partial [Oscillospiraceae bacterium]|nr:hypothetical protein [Oscillospiraceae bacterium]
MKKTLYRIFAFTLAAAIMLALSSCGGRNVNADTGAFGSASPSVSPSANTSTAPTQTAAPTPVPTSQTEQVSLEQLLSEGKADEVQRIVLTDPQLGIEAARAYGTSAWTGNGYVDWSSGNWGNPAVIYFNAATQAGAAVGAVSIMAYVDPSSILVEGGYAGQIPVAEYLSSEQYCYNILLGAFPGATDIQQIGAIYPTAEEQAA